MSYLHSKEHHGILGEELENVSEREEGDVDVVPRHHHEHEALHSGHEVPVREHDPLKYRIGLVLLRTLFTAKSTHIQLYSFI